MFLPHSIFRFFTNLLFFLGVLIQHVFIQFDDGYGVDDYRYGCCLSEWGWPWNSTGTSPWQSSSHAIRYLCYKQARYICILFLQQFHHFQLCISFRLLCLVMIDICIRNHCGVVDHLSLFKSFFCLFEIGCVSQVRIQKQNASDNERNNERCFSVFILHLGVGFSRKSNVKRAIIVL